MALIKIEEVSKNVRIGIWKAGEEIDFFRSRLPPGYMTGFSGERFSKNRQREFLASRFLLREMLNDDSAAIAVNENGSLSVAGGPSISLSHSKEMVAAMVGENRSVGIDIEEISGRVKKVMHKFINAHEKDLLGNNPELWKITLCWSAKESIYKMTGRMGLSFSDDIHLEIPHSQEAGSFKSRIKKNEKEIIQTVFFEITNGFILSYCFENPVLLPPQGVKIT